MEKHVSGQSFPPLLNHVLQEGPSPTPDLRLFKCSFCCEHLLSAITLSSVLMAPHLVFSPCSHYCLDPTLIFCCLGCPRTTSKTGFQIGRSKKALVPGTGWSIKLNILQIICIISVSLAICSYEVTKFWKQKHPEESEKEDQATEYPWSSCTHPSTHVRKSEREYIVRP